VLQLVERENPANAKRKDFFFREHRLWNDGNWTVADDAVPVPRAWFKARKPS